MKVGLVKGQVSYINIHNGYKVYGVFTIDVLVCIYIKVAGQPLSLLTDNYIHKTLNVLCKQCSEYSHQCYAKTYSVYRIEIKNTLYF